MKTDLGSIAADLRAEQDALDAVVAALTDAGWDTPTASAGWSVRDQIGHLTYFDGTATLAITDPGGFAASFAALVNSEGGIDAETLHRDLPTAELLARWRDGRAALAAAAAQLADGDRVPWYGPSMSAKSFLTARLMETWAHGHDVVDALGADRPATDRLRHIARLGFITRGWSYTNRGESVPSTEVGVELIAPSGAIWSFGDDAASGNDESVVRGPAEDFCLVVTQRRHVDDTELDLTGAAARDWMLKAQAFAGPPTDGPRPRTIRPSQGEPI